MPLLSVNAKSMYTQKQNNMNKWSHSKYTCYSVVVIDLDALSVFFSLHCVVYVLWQSMCDYQLDWKGPLFIIIYFKKKFWHCYGLFRACNVHNKELQFCNSFEKNGVWLEIVSIWLKEWKNNLISHAALIHVVREIWIIQITLSRCHTQNKVWMRFDRVVTCGTGTGMCEKTGGIHSSKRNLSHPHTYKHAYGDFSITEASRCDNNVCAKVLSATFNCCIYYKVLRCQLCWHGAQILLLFKQPGCRKAIGGHRNLGVNVNLICETRII